MAKNAKDVMELTEAIKIESVLLKSVKTEIAKVIIGQNSMIDRLLNAMLSGGHVLLEGVPGLAKTLTVSTLTKTIAASFKRLQFTPDLLPADIIGTDIYDMKKGTFSAKKGPIFANIILADEINRSPAKVQSALLEAMGENQVTIGESTYKLPELFFVLATQNPIEHEGTYPLAEAQLDRFMYKIILSYPEKDEEKAIISRDNQSMLKTVSSVCPIKYILKMREIISMIHIEERLLDYVVEIIDATRNMEKYKLPTGYVEYGASPRAGINIIKGAKAGAFMNGRGFVIPDDIRSIATDVLRHRISVTYEAEAENITSEMIIGKILATIEVP